MKAIIAPDALFVYPGLRQPYDVETDASNCQLGAVIKQNGHPVASYSRKLHSMQKNYTTIEKELLQLEHPALDEKQGRVLTNFKTIYKYQQQDPILPELT